MGGLIASTTAEAVIGDRRVFRRSVQRALVADQLVVEHLARPIQRDLVVVVDLELLPDSASRRPLFGSESGICIAQRLVDIRLVCLCGDAEPCGTAHFVDRYAFGAAQVKHADVVLGDLVAPVAGLLVHLQRLAEIPALYRILRALFIVFARQVFDRDRWIAGERVLGRLGSARQATRQAGHQ
jgi:hypothetical protein